jgi:hypothetical protein
VREGARSGGTVEYREIIQGNERREEKKKNKERIER